jgi:hypothetical protein
MNPDDYRAAIKTEEQAEKAYDDLIRLTVELARFLENFGRAPAVLHERQKEAEVRFAELHKRLTACEPDVTEG